MFQINHTVGHNEGVQGWSSLSRSRRKPFVIFPLCSPRLYASLLYCHLELVSQFLINCKVFLLRGEENSSTLQYFPFTYFTLFLCLPVVFALAWNVLVCHTVPFNHFDVVVWDLWKSLLYLCLWQMYVAISWCAVLCTSMLVQANVSDLILVCINSPGIHSVILETCKPVCLLLCLSRWLQWLAQPW